MTYPPIRTSMQLTLDNLVTVSHWIRDHGGATAGMRLIYTGDVTQRGIQLGTLDGSIIEIGVGDWVRMELDGGFTVEGAGDVYRPPPTPASIPLPWVVPKGPPSS